MSATPDWVRTYTRIYRYSVWLILLPVLVGFFEISMAGIHVVETAYGPAAVPTMQAFSTSFAAALTMLVATVMTNWTPVEPLIERAIGDVTIRP